MDMDPGEGTSDGRVRCKPSSTAVEIKQEPAIKEEPLDEIRWVTNLNETSVGDVVTTASNIELDSESENDFVLDLELNGVKEEMKYEEDKAEEDSPADPSSSKDAPISRGNQDNEPMVNSNVSRQRFNSSGKVKKRDGSRKQNKRTIPRNKAAKKRKEHKCHVCGYVASDKSKLTIHIRIHTGDKPYKCDDCSKSFTQKSNLNQHKKIHSAEKRFKCPVCFKSFTEKSHLNDHLRTHTDQLPHSCSKCGQRFAEEEIKHSYEKRCKRRRYECNLCEFKCFIKVNLKRHMQSRLTGEHRFQCEICGKKCIHKGHLNQHLATHRDQFPFRCTKCRRGFKNADNQAAHKKICRRRHYQCYICEYSTLKTTNLRNHMRVHHTGEKPFHCKWCDKCFIREYEAKSHMKRIHQSKK